MADDFGSIPIEAPEKAQAPKPPRKKREKPTPAASDPLSEPIPIDPEPKIDSTEETIIVPPTDRPSIDTSHSNISHATGDVKAHANDITGSETKEKAPEPPTKKPRKLQNIALFFIALLFLSVGAYSLLGFVGIPYYLQDKLNRNFTAKTNLHLNQPKISFNPYTFTLDVKNIEVSNQQQGPHSKLLTITAAQAHLAPASLLERKVIFSDLTISEPLLSLHRANDGSYNFGRNLFNQEVSSPSTLQDIPFFFAVKNITLQDGGFTFNDEPTAKVHTGENISASYPGFGNFDFPRDLLLPPSFSATINDSPVHFAKSSDASATSKIAMDVDNMDLGLYLNYLPLTIPFEIKQSNAQGQFELFFAKSKEGKELLTVGFHVKAYDVKLQHNNKKARLSLKQFTVNAQYQPFSKDLTIKELSVVEPILDIKDDIQLRGIASLLPQKFLEADANRLCLDKLLVEDGKINITGKESTQFDKIHLSLLGYENSETDILSPLSFGLHNLRDKSSVSWQGQLISGHAEGELQWKNVPIGRVLQFIKAPSNPENKGRADITGPLTIKREAGSFSSVLGKGDIMLKKVELYAKNGLWLKTDNISIAGVNVSQGKKRLGDVTIEKGKLFINGDQLPPLLSKLSHKEGSISSLDFTGTAKITKKGLPAIDVRKLKLYADKLDQDQLSADNLQVSATFADKSTATAKGRGKISPLSLWLGVKFTNLKSQEVLAWFCTEKVFSETNSKISGTGRLILPSLSFKGDIQSGPATVKQNGKTLFKWQANSVKGLEYKASDKSLSIASLSVTKPTLTWNRGKREPAIYSKTRNFMVHLLGEYGVNKAAPLKSLKIRKLSFKDGNLTIHDKRFNKAWNGRISSFAGTLEAIDSTNKSAPFVFNYSGTFAGSSIRLQGNADVFSPSPHHEFTLNLKNFPPTTFAAQLPELRKKITLPGFVDVKIFQKSSKDQINTVTDILLKKVTPVNDKEALTLALLRGTKEHATVSVLSQNNNPDKDVPLILSIQEQVNKLLVKAEISPFLLVNKKYTDLVNLSSVEYRFGEIRPTNQATKELMHLRDFLNDYPRISLVIEGEASLSADRAALQKQLQKSEAERVDAINKQRLNNWNEEPDPFDIGTTDDAFMEENIFIPLQEETIDVPRKMLIDLANQRAELLQTTLVKQLGLDKSRIIVEKTKTLSENSSNVARFSLTAKP